MISATFVGLCLTSIPSVIRVFQRPFRPDVLLAPRFPAWLDAAHGPVSLPSDEVCRYCKEFVVVTGLTSSLAGCTCPRARRVG